MRATLRDLGIGLGRLPSGPTNTVADVGARLGHRTIVFGDGPLRVGHGPARTGVSVLVPPGEAPWTAACHVINGYGKTMGLIQVAELGTLESPIFFTNTLSVGAVQQGYLRHLRHIGAFHPRRSHNVLVSECNDGHLSDLWGLHVRPADAGRALADARRGEVVQGSVGAGTGMVAYGHKGGFGTASRRTPAGATVAALVLANCGRPEELRLGGVPVGEDGGVAEPPPGSIIIALVTDAATDTHSLGRIAARATHGLARTGTISANGSGDVAIALTTGRGPDAPIDELFLAAIESTEEAIWNALCTAEDCTGRDGHTVRALDHGAVRRAWARAHGAAGWDV